MSNFQQANDFLMTEGGKSFPFNELGDKVVGEVTSAEIRQQTDLDTGEKLTWNDGQPRMQLVIELQTALREGDNDDGIRTIYAKGGRFDVGSGTGLAMKDAIATAVREGGGSGLNPGDQLVVAWTGEGVKKNRGFNAPKLYTASYRKAVAAVSGADLFDD